MSIGAFEYLLLGTAAFVMSGALTWLIRKLAIWVGAMDKPTIERKTQKEPVPYLGGVSIALLPILLAVPILDTCIAVFSRIRRGISPFTGGKVHLSHRLMRKGFSKRNTAYCLWGMQASFVALALITFKWTSAVGTPAIAVAGAYWLGAFIWFWRIPSTD